MGFGRMLRKSLAADSKLGWAVVNVGELHRLAAYGSLARFVYPGTFACCTQPITTAALKNKIAYRTSRKNYHTRQEIPTVFIDGCASPTNLDTALGADIFLPHR